MPTISRSWSSTASKPANEPCTDALYQAAQGTVRQCKKRLDRIAGRQRLEPSARIAHGRSAAIERLNRLRELFFTDEFSLGAQQDSAGAPIDDRQISQLCGKCALGSRRHACSRPSICRPITTIIVPEAGRNSEFEDRLIANRDWLQRIFAMQRARKCDGIVLFCDGDPLARPAHACCELGRSATALPKRVSRSWRSRPDFPAKCWWYMDRRRTTADAADSIDWHDNLGDLEVASGWIKLRVQPSCQTLFAIGNDPAMQTITRQ